MIQKPWDIASRLMSSVILLFLMTSVFVPSAASAMPARAKIIKVSGFLSDGFLDINEDGTRSGYQFDYLMEIAQYTGWQYEFVDSSWQESLSMLESGEIDLMGTVLKTPEREAVFDYPNFAMGSGYGVLVTDLDSESLPYDDFETFNGMPVGALLGNQQAQNFLDYSVRNGFTPEMHYFATQPEMDAALQKGAIQAMVMTSVLRTMDLRIIAKFGEENYYFATTKGNAEVLEGLNRAMEHIQFNNPFYNNNLNRKYFDLQVSTPVSFSREELAYIRSSGPIRCVYNPDFQPISYFDSASGGFQGIAADVCGWIAQKTGLRFEYIQSSSYQEALEAFLRPDTTLLVGKTHDFSWAQQNNAFLTIPFLKGQTIMATKGAPRDNPVVAVYDQAGLSGMENTALRGASGIKRYQTIAECLDAVRKGDADATFINSNVMSYHMNNPKYLVLQFTPLYGYATDTCIAVDGRTDPILVSILNKALGTISNAQISESVSAHLKANYYGSITSYAYARPFDFALLVAGVFLVIAGIVTLMLYHRAKSAKTMKHMLYTDALTGYPNYKALTEEAPRLIGSHPESYAIVYMDMHQFKSVNDTFGYDAGDRLLKEISGLVSGFVKKNERFARMYADKFVLLLQFEGQGAFAKRMELLSAGLDGLCTGKGEFETVNLLFSGGIFRLQKDACDLDMACDRANYAKDTISELCANTFVYYDDVMRSRILSERALEGSMQRALDNGEFIPYYQPKVNVITGEVVGVEALVRWNHPERGILPPGAFIPFFEKNGFVVKIDFDIFDQVCMRLREWIDGGNEPVPVSINFSRRHMLDRRFVQKIKDIADRRHAPPALLEIEITETVELESLDVAVEFARSLKKCGFSISIDDYGTGYSSISFLQKIPFDVLKLDKSFIENAMKSQMAGDIMRHLVMAVRDNGVRVLCEGIETEEQRDFIISQNCRFAQGFLYAKPMPWDAFERYLSRSKIARHETTDFISSRDFEQHIWLSASDFMGRVLPGGILACNIDEGFSVFYINEQMLSMLGYSEYEFMREAGGLFANAVHPGDRRRIGDEMNRHLMDQNEYQLQYRMLKKDGSYIWVRDVGKKVVTDDNREVLLCILTDITDLVSLQKQKDDLINAIPGGVGEMLLTREGPVLLSATENFYTVIGHTREQMEALGNKLFAVVHPNDFDKILASMEDSLAVKKTTCECTFRVRYADEAVHWASIQGSLRDTERGKLVTAVCFNTDEEMKNRRDIEIAKAQMALAVTLAHHAIFEYDVRTGEIRNQTGLDNYFRPELAHVSVPEGLIEAGIIHPEDIGSARTVYGRIVNGEPFAFCELRLCKNSASDNQPYAWVHITLSAIYDDDGHPVKAVGFVENVDRIKRLERLFAWDGRYRHVIGEIALLAYEINVTQDTCEQFSGVRQKRLESVLRPLARPYRYSDMLRAAAGQMVADKSRADFLRDMDPDQLLALNSRGTQDPVFEYRRLMPDGLELWVSANLHLRTDPATGDVVCFAYYFDIQAQKKVEETLRYYAAHPGQQNEWR